MTESESPTETKIETETDFGTECKSETRTKNQKLRLTLLFKNCGRVMNLISTLILSKTETID